MCGQFLAVFILSKCLDDSLHDLRRNRNQMDLVEHTIKIMVVDVVVESDNSLNHVWVSLGCHI